MHALLGVFRSFSLLSVRLLSLLHSNFRAGYTFKSRMCRGIVGDDFLHLRLHSWEDKDHKRSSIYVQILRGACVLVLEETDLLYCTATLMLKDHGFGCTLQLTWAPEDVDFFGAWRTTWGFKRRPFTTGKLNVGETFEEKGNITALNRVEPPGNGRLPSETKPPLNWENPPGNARLSNGTFSTGNEPLINGNAALGNGPALKGELETAKGAPLNWG